MEDEPGQKLNFLANPSTKSLKERFRDPILYRVGITRLETRHGFPPLNSDGISYNQGSLVPAACVPTYEEVLNEHKQHRQLLIQDWKNNLRQCSIEEHLLQIESRISHALGVYIPAMGVFKSNAVKQKTMSQKRANGQPDGCMIYFHNSLTSKCTGTMINSTFNKNGSIIEDGCKTVARVAVWGTPVGKRNLLYILVAGPGACIENSFNEKKIRPGFDIMRNCWFRPFYIDEDQSTISTAVVQKSIVNSPRMMWPPAKNGQYKGRTYRKYAACDANMTCVGVDNSKLHHLKLGIMRKDIFPDYRKWEVMYTLFSIGQTHSLRDSRRLVQEGCFKYGGLTRKLEWNGSLSLTQSKGKFIIHQQTKQLIFPIHAQVFQQTSGYQY